METALIKAGLAELDHPLDILDVDAALAHLQDVDSFWAESPREEQRAFIREVFQRISANGPEITTIMPRAEYAPLFALDRRECFGQEGPEDPVVNWLPGQDSNL